MSTALRNNFVLPKSGEIMPSWEMKVEQVFKFGGGRAVFVGRITGTEKFIKTSRCDVFINDVLYSSVEIEGEMLPERATQLGVRSISTKTPIDVSHVTTGLAHCRLVCK